jgi:hypothetical protein
MERDCDKDGLEVIESLVELVGIELWSRIERAIHVAREVHRSATFALGYSPFVNVRLLDMVRAIPAAEFASYPYDCSAPSPGPSWSVFATARWMPAWFIRRRRGSALRTSPAKC